MNRTKLRTVAEIVAVAVVGIPVVAGFLLVFAYATCNGQTDLLPYWPF